MLGKGQEGEELTVGRMVVSIVLGDERRRRGKAPTGAIHEVSGIKGEDDDELGDVVEVT